VIASLDVVELESVVAGDGGLRSLVDGDGITVGIRVGAARGHREPDTPCGRSLDVPAAAAEPG